MSNCIFPGRFQPFHTGHLLVVKGMMKACGRAVIVICRDAGDNGGDDLFSEEEVREMISAALLHEDIVDAEIVSITNCEDDKEWMDKILESADNPPDPEIWTGNEDVKKIAEEHNIDVKTITPVPGHNSEEIREMIKTKDRTWLSKVPGGANDVIMRSIGE